MGHIIPVVTSLTLQSKKIEIWFMFLYVLNISSDGTVNTFSAIPIRMAGVTCDNSMVSLQGKYLFLKILFGSIALLNVEINGVGVSHEYDRFAFLSLINILCIFRTFLTFIACLIVVSVLRVSALHSNTPFRSHVENLFCTVCTLTAIKIWFCNWT